MDCPRVKGQVITYEKEEAKICLECPYPVCLQEIEKGAGRLSREERAVRDKAIREERKTMNTMDLALKYNLTPRTIQEICRKRSKLDRGCII